MKDRVNIILLVTTSLICMSGMVIGVVGDAAQRRSMLCPGIRVCVADSAVNRFADARGIVRLIDSRYGGYVNVPMESIDLWKMEKMLMDMDFVESASCFVTRDAVVNVRVTQTSPVAKYYDGEELTYISAGGKRMKTSRDWKAGIVNISGCPDLDDDKFMSELGACCEHLLNNSGGLRGRVARIECEPNSECILFLVDRPESFLLGKPENAVSKLEKVLKYEKQIIPCVAADSGKYSTVDVRYYGQIICK